VSPAEPRTYRTPVRRMIRPTGDCHPPQYRATIGGMRGRSKPVTPDDIRLAFVTVRRSPEYLHCALASLFLSDPLAYRLKGVHVVMGSAEVQFLSPYFHHRRLTIHPMDPAESLHLSRWQPI